MDSNENLNKHVERLCSALNKAQMYSNFSGEPKPWKIRINGKVTFGGGISCDEKAFNFLRRKGMIDIGVCWKCGNEPITGDYVFSVAQNTKISYPVCETCYMKGQRVTKARNEFHDSIGEINQTRPIRKTSIEQNNSKTSTSWKVLVGIISFVGWVLVTQPFIEYKYVLGERVLTNSSWFSLIVITVIYIGILVTFRNKRKSKQL